jgi:hypothetical protein
VHAHESGLFTTAAPHAPFTHSPRHSAPDPQLAPSTLPHLPSAAHTLSAHWLALLQLSPAATAQVLVNTLHKPVAQIAVPEAGVQFASCKPSSGSAVPAVSRGRQAPVSRRQYSAAPQSPSVQQPCAGTQTLPLQVAD